MAERHLSLEHTTIMRWVHHYAPEFERRWNRFARTKLGRIMACRRDLREDPWQVGVAYTGRWMAPVRPVDFPLRSGKRDVGAAKAFFREATIKRQGSTPRTITLDGYAASHRACA